jgi:anaerobic selenocysteine-containing dehydrogenase
MSRIKPSTCTICNCECGLLAEVDGNRIVRVKGDPEDPHNQGALCPKGKLAPRWIEAPGRLTHPLIRRKNSDRAMKAGWEEALDFIAHRLTRIKENHGPAALAFYYGSSPNYLSRVFHDALARWFGTPNAAGSWSLCVGPKVLGFESVYGRTGSFARGDFPNARLIVLWGANPAETAMHRYLRLWPDVLSARKRGARLVVIDPRPTRTARAADLHLAVKPGTDHLLAVALIKLLLDKNLIHHDYLSRNADGFDALVSALGEFDARAAVSRTGLPWMQVRTLAKELGTIRPALVDRREGTIHHAHSTRLNRAIAVINALIGSVDVEGGLIFGAGRPLKSDLGVADHRIESPLWAHRFPLAKDAVSQITEAILNDRPRPVRALIVACGNPVSAWPAAFQTRSALARLDLLVVNDLFPTETTDLAHVVLPGASFFEKGDMSDSPLRLGWWVKTTEPLIVPPGQARPEWRVAVDLARRLGCDALSPYMTEDDVFARILADSALPDLDPRDLRRGRMLEINRPGRYLKGGFPTPTGRMSLFRDAFARPAFSRWLEPVDACTSQPDYPLRLITGARNVAYYHSQQRNVFELRRISPQPAAEIAPQLAEEAGVSEKDMLTIITPHGRLRLPVSITPGMDASTISIPHGWPYPANANDLTGPEPMDAVAGMPAYRAVPCRVRK